MGIRKQAANLLTLCRLLGGLGLLALPAFSSGFWALYLFCGLTDMADGPVARRIGSASVFGARLDTAADADHRHQDREPPLGPPPWEGPRDGAHGAEPPDGIGPLPVAADAAVGGAPPKRPPGLPSGHSGGAPGGEGPPRPVPHVKEPPAPLGAEAGSDARASK